MTSKSIIMWVVILGIIVLGVGAIYFYNQQPASPSQNSADTTTAGATGKVIFGIKDAAASMGSVTSVMLTINKVELHNQAQEWVTVSSETKSFDLLMLKASGATALLAQSDVTVGTYDQMRLMVSKVMVTQNGATSEAKLPSGELKIVGMMVVNADKTSTAVVDFIADESLHTTGNGKIIFAPVIHIQTKSDTDATVDANNQVHVSAGHVDNDSDEGMDVDGQMKANFQLDTSTKLDIDTTTGGIIKAVIK